MKSTVIENIFTALNLFCVLFALYGFVLIFDGETWKGLTIFLIGVISSFITILTWVSVEQEIKGKDE